jgi:hypothetical protein
MAKVRPEKNAAPAVGDDKNVTGSSLATYDEHNM